MNDIFVYPLAHHIAGVDEVGRGALVGPVIAAAVILNPAHSIIGLTDSKKLSEIKRNVLYEKIIDNAISWSIGRAEPQEIDKLNIFYATMLAMQRAIWGLSIEPNFVLIDGNKKPQLSIASQAIVKGDIFVQEISAASIIAKVTRDREMITLDKQFPEYNFAKNKGYPTALHLQCLIHFGITKHHRYSFKPVKRILLNCLEK
ncbi:ribonuclease HII [Candidatus Profftia lariciata]|uniref:ribonuclease HII n=1 Tax=Candidatus Profftia lariciata TaxID=1987921 RepID=UPI001D020C97|nr:ribonuclease HII [Candidatus Profftia lariciata]